ncbi:MAG: methyltransferase domain-containing protein [Anaerolineae bacterium]|nr:methyltransferase domain-containing protein [Anaerolineae bacterium]
MNSEGVIQRLLEMDEIRSPIMKRIIDSLKLPVASCGLDVGCGIGLQSRILAEKVGLGGKITSLDLNSEILETAASLTIKANLGSQIDFRQGSFTDLPFEDQKFDWIWSADCVGYPTGDLDVVLPELSRVVKRNGSVFISAWSSQRILPGYPLLENRLNADYSAYNPYLQGKLPENHFLNMQYWFEKFGLEQVSVNTFSMDLQAPLTPLEQKALASLFEMLWERPVSSTSSQEWKDFDRLCKLESAEFLPARQDYYGFFTYTLFQAVKP